jgi:hypothetical protein
MTSFLPPQILCNIAIATTKLVAIQSRNSKRFSRRILTDPIHLNISYHNVHTKRHLQKEMLLTQNTPFTKIQFEHLINLLMEYEFLKYPQNPTHPS